MVSLFGATGAAGAAGLVDAAGCRHRDIPKRPVRPVRSACRHRDIPERRVRTR